MNSNNSALSLLSKVNPDLATDPFWTKDLIERPTTFGSADRNSFNIRKETPYDVRRGISFCFLFVCKTSILYT